MTLSLQFANYNEDQVFRGMVIENITQRTNDFMELNENIVAIENYINSKPEILITLRESRGVNEYCLVYETLVNQKIQERA